MGNLVAVTLPDLATALDTMHFASLFGARLQARGVCAVSPLELAARHLFTARAAGVALPAPGEAVAAGFGRVIMARADALAVLCLPGWDDCQRVAVEMSESLLANRRLFLVRADG